LKKAGVEPQPEDRLVPRIRELLVQQRMEAVLEDWLVNLRSQSEIHFTLESGPPSAKPLPTNSSETLLQHP
jgi:hypothetical protein